MLVRFSGCLNHIKRKFISIIISIVVVVVVVQLQRQFFDFVEL